VEARGAGACADQLTGQLRETREEAHGAGAGAGQLHPLAGQGREEASAEGEHADQLDSQLAEAPEEILPQLSQLAVELIGELARRARLLAGLALLAGEAGRRARPRRAPPPASR